MPAGARLTNSGTIRGLASGAVGDEPRAQRWYRRAKETERGETDGGESEYLIVALKLGNGPSRTQRSEGGAASCPEGRHHAGDIEPHSVYPEGQLIVRGTASDVTSPMRETRTSGSVGAPGSNPRGDPAVLRSEQLRL